MSKRSMTEIEADILRTRQALNSALDTIGQEMAPQQLMRQGIHMARQTINDHAADIGSALARNPIPLAMIGIGLGWLAVGAAIKPKRNGASAPNNGASDDQTVDPIVRTASRIEELAASVAEELRVGENDPADDAVSRLRHPGHDSNETNVPNGEARSASRLDMVREFSEGIYGRATGYVEEAGDSVRDLGGRVGDMIDRYPLAVGGVAAVVGALLALGLPPTEQEDRMLGDTRDSLRDRALDTGREVLTKAEDTAGRAAAAAIDAAREELEADDSLDPAAK